MSAVTNALQALVGTHYAAIYGYSVVGVHLTDSGQQNTARTLQEQHRDARDAVVALLADAGLQPDPPAVVYRPASAVIDAGSAAKWALALEEACAAGYRTVLLAGAGGTVADPAATAPATGSATASGSATPTASSSASGSAAPSATPATLATTAIRQFAFTGLTTAAGNAVAWRAVVTPSAPSVAFPGL